jgi:hypothetical protein
MSDTNRHPLNKLSSLLFYDMLKMREKVQERILKKMEDESTSTDELLAMMESYIQINDVVEKEVKGRLVSLERGRLYGKDYRKEKP